MAEKIVNGTFATNLNGWSNIGNLPFQAVGGKAQGTSQGPYECSFCLRQSFTKYGTTISATISATIYYWADEGEDENHNGYNRFCIELDIPGGGSVILYENEFGIGSDQVVALNNVDISSYMVNNGTYYLRLSLFNRAAITGYYFEPSYGDYDNISIQVVERFKHTAQEGIGATEDPRRKSLKSLSAALGLAESIASIGGGDDMAKSESIGLIELAIGKAKVTFLETLGAIGQLARTYGHCHHDIPTNAVGLRESMMARVVDGNITRIVSRFDTGTRWMPRVPAETEWEQVR